MSGDEIAVFGVCVIAGLAFGSRALGPLATLSRLHASPATRVAVLASWGLAMVIVHGTMITLAAWDVQSSVTYTGFYDLMGLAWLATSSAGLHHFGLSLRDDVLERRNHAALAAHSGALLGIAFAFAGGNIGDGPGWWCVVVASGLATAALFAVWIALHVIARVPETITVDRDLGAGIRVGALLAGCGLIFGGAAAGTWISFGDTVLSFAASAWPALPIVALGLGLEVVLAPRPGRARPPLAISIAAAMVYVGAALVIARWHGIPQ